MWSHLDQCDQCDQSSRSLAIFLVYFLATCVFLLSHCLLFTVTALSAFSFHQHSLVLLPTIMFLSTILINCFKKPILDEIPSAFCLCRNDLILHSWCLSLVKLFSDCMVMRFLCVSSWNYPNVLVSFCSGS